VSLSELQHAKVFFLSLLSTLLGTPNEIKEREKVKKILEAYQNFSNNTIDIVKKISTRRIKKIKEAHQQ